MRPLLCTLASTVVLLGVPHAARAQRAGAGGPEREPQTSTAPARIVEPTAAVTAALGHEHAVLRYSAARRADTPWDWTQPLTTQRGRCYELVGFAAGSSRVTAEFRARTARVGEPVLLSAGTEVAHGALRAELPGRLYSVAVHAEGPARFAVAVRERECASEQAGAEGREREHESEGATVAAGTTPVNGGHPAQAPAAAEQVPARPIPIGGTESDYVATQLRAFAQAQHLTRALAPAVRESLATNQSHEVPLALTGGACVDIAAVGVPSMRDVDLELADPAGNRVARDAGHRGSESLHYCAPYTGTYRLTVRAFAGFGLTGIQAFEGH